MEIPRLDNTAHADILARIGELARAYTPEWSFDPEKPDIGVAAAELYAGMAEGVLKKYNKTAEKNMVEFFSRLGASRFHSEPASGYVCMRISGSETNVEGEVLPSGSELSCETSDGESVSFTTSGDVYVLNSTITDVFYEDMTTDSIYCIAENNDTDRIEDITTTGDPDRDLQKHILYFSSEELDNVTAETEGLVTFVLDGADKEREEEFSRCIAALGLYYSAEDGYVPCRDISYESGVLHFYFDKDRLPQRTEFEGIESYWFKAELNEPGAFMGSYLKTIRTATARSSIRPDAVFNDSEQLTVDSFVPYSINPLPYSSVYFVSDTALCRAGSSISLEFRVDYDAHPINDDDNEQDIDWKYIMKKSRFKKPKEYDIKIRSVVWEYFNGSGWVRLFKDNSFCGVFNGENNSCTVHMSFECPEDIAPALMPSGEVYAIRARIVSVENQFKLFGRYITPRVSSVRFSYSYSTHPESTNAVSENCMERRLHDLIKGDSFRPFIPLETNGRALYIGFTSPPGFCDVRLLFVGRSTAHINSGGGLWEYCTGKRWQTLVCSDGTEGLTKTGILLLGDNRGFAKCRRFDRDRYWIRIRFPDPAQYPKKNLDGIYLNAVKVRGIQYREPEYFFISPDDDNVCRLSESNVYEANVYVNEAGDVTAAEAERMIHEGEADAEYGDSGEILRLWVRWSELSEADDISRSYILDRERSEIIFGTSGGRLPSETETENVRIDYSISSGEKGDLPEGSELALSSVSGGLISGAYAPTELAGGLGRETLTHAVVRASEQLRTFSRGCTENDLECLVRQAERSVLRVKCLGGRSRTGEIEKGAVTIVVRLRSMEAFNDRAAELKSYIQKRSCANIRPDKLSVIAPTSVICDVTCELYTDSYEKAGKVKQAAEKAIKRYFDAENGGSEQKGWDIGSLPERAAVYADVAEVKGITSISSFYMEMFDEEGNEINDSELSDIAAKGMSIPMAGKIKVDVRVNN